MLRRRMLRRKTDPKTGKHTECEPSQSKCTWIFHKSHLVRTFTEKVAEDRPAASVLCIQSLQVRWQIHTENAA